MNHVTPDPHILARAPAWLYGSVGRMVGFLTPIIGLLAWGGTAGRRLAGLAAVYLVLAATQLLLIRTARAPGQVQSRTLFVYLSVTVAHGLAFVLTGGLASPLLPLLAMPIAGPAFLLRNASDRRTTWIAVVAMLLLVASAPASWTAIPALPQWVAGLAALSALLWAILSIREALTMNLDVQGRMQCCLDEMKEEQVVAAAQQLRRLQSVGAKVAHELKNPLASIKGLVQLIERSAQEPRAQERLRVVSSEILRMETILREYLSYSRPLEDLRLEDVDLQALTADVESILSGRAEHAGVEVVRRVAPLRLVGDSRRLKEALINILSNAIEATPKGGTVEVAAVPEPDHARITIRDTGVGLTQEQLTKIGQSFWTTRPGGTGLGVVLARSAIVQHGGKLHYASESGAGTTVTVELPYRPPGPDGSGPAL